MGITDRGCRLCGDAIRPTEKVLTQSGHYCLLIDVPPHDRVFHPRCLAERMRTTTPSVTVDGLTGTTSFTDRVESNPRANPLNARLTNARDR